MTENNCCEVLSNLQLLQDLLSEQFNMFLVLVDQNGNELTLPSKLPLTCYENSSTDTACQNCLPACIAKPAGSSGEPILYHCHHNMFYTLIKTNIHYAKPVFLIAGFTVDPRPVAETAPLLQAIFNLPITLDSSLILTVAKKSGALVGNSFGLTQQELLILRYMVNGLTNQDIAVKLYISLNTVKTHIAHIFSKIKVSNRTEAAMFALENGLMETAKNEIP